MEAPPDIMLDWYRQGDYQADTVEYIRRLIGPGVVAYDVGAHAGYVTRAMLDTGARVVAFEPNPDTFRYLITNVPEAVCVNVAVGSKVSTGRMHVRPGGNSGQHEVHSDPDGDILMLPLSHFAPRPNFVKVDAQGWDLEVIRGLLPYRCHAVIEWWPEGVRDIIGRDPDEALRELEGFGYELHHIGVPSSDWWDIHLVPIGGL